MKVHIQPICTIYWSRILFSSSSQALNDRFTSTNIYTNDLHSQLPTNIITIMQLSIATLFALATALSLASAVVPPRPTGTPVGSGAVQFKTLLEGGAAIPFYHDANRAGHVGETDWKDLFFTPSDQDLDTWFVNTRGNATKTYVGKVGFIPMVDANKPGPKVSRFSLSSQFL